MQHSLPQPPGSWRWELDAEGCPKGGRFELKPSGEGSLNHADIQMAFPGKGRLTGKVLHRSTQHTHEGNVSHRLEAQQCTFRVN